MCCFQNVTMKKKKDFFKKSGIFLTIWQEEYLYACWKSLPSTLADKDEEIKKRG